MVKKKFAIYLSIMPENSLLMLFQKVPHVLLQQIFKSCTFDVKCLIHFDISLQFVEQRLIMLEKNKI